MDVPDRRGASRFRALRCWSALLLGVLLLAAGCETGQRTGSAAESERSAEPAPSKDTITYAELRRRYNERTEKIEQMWARAVVEPEWVDRRGKRHREQVDGPLIVRKPSELALALGKLGNYFYWMGSDEERFWVFNLKPPKDQPTTAYVGPHTAFAEASQERLPLPIRPDRIPDLLGVTSLPPAEAARLTAVAELGPEELASLSDDEALPGGPLELEHGYLVGYEPRKAEGSGPGQFLSLLVDERYRPRLVLVSAITGTAKAPSGESPWILRDGSTLEPVLIARLSEYKPLEQAGKGKGRWPAVPTLIEARLLDRKASLKINLSDMTDGKRRDKIHDAVFEFDRLLEIHDPERVRELRAGAAGGRAEAGGNGSE